MSWEAEKVHAVLTRVNNNQKLFSLLTAHQLENMCGGTGSDNTEESND